ncbi:hypothetical protein CRYUN_Cryun35bG0036100 [Craigia yunnanensis]
MDKVTMTIKAALGLSRGNVILAFKQQMNRQKLQLLGVSSMLIAYRKYEEINPPNVEDFCYITDNTYTKDEVVKMEADILKFLKFELGNPTLKTFLRRITRVAQEDYEASSLQLEFLGYSLAELSWLDYYGCVNFLPYMVVASVIFLTRRGGALQAVREKYKQHKFKCVATMPASPEIPASYFEDVQVVKVCHV